MDKTKLSVNINKIATLRNARGGNNPEVVKTAVLCEKFGAQGITVHPRPDERHITGKDVYELKEVVTTEFNIEGYPDDRYMQIIRDVRPDQATLVPDPPEALTSNAGWDTVTHFDFLSKRIEQLKEWGVRTSIFIDPDERMIENAARLGTSRIELYTEPYAAQFHQDCQSAIAPFVKAGQFATGLGLELNAGHDLDLNNLGYLISNIPVIKEVSIGHALVCDALIFGLQNTIPLYLRKIDEAQL